MFYSSNVIYESLMEDSFLEDIEEDENLDWNSRKHSNNSTQVAATWCIHICSQLYYSLDSREAIIKRQPMAGG